MASLATQERLLAASVMIVVCAGIAWMVSRPGTQTAEAGEPSPIQGVDEFTASVAPESAPRDDAGTRAGAEQPAAANRTETLNPDWRARLRAQRTAHGKLVEEPDDEASGALARLGDVLSAKDVTKAVKALGLPVHGIAGHEASCKELIDSFREPHRNNLKLFGDQTGKVMSQVSARIGPGQSKLVLRRDVRRGRAKRMFVGNTDLWVYADEFPEFFGCFDEADRLFRAMHEVVATELGISPRMQNGR